MIHQWAKQWRIPDEALADLLAKLGAAASPEQKHKDAQTETGVVCRERLIASECGGRLWRNNVGVDEVRDEQTGKVLRVIRYGLCNDSKKINKQIKSSDLIGIMPVKITRQMVGTIIGQFVARECKHPGWVYRGDEREAAQLAFISLICMLGGDGRFVS